MRRYVFTYPDFDGPTAKFFDDARQLLAYVSGFTHGEKPVHVFFDIDGDVFIKGDA